MADTDKPGFTVVIGTDMGPMALEPGDIQQLYFIEDIFSFCITGKMIFDDYFGFVEHGPLTGNERLLLAYGGSHDKGEERRIVFDIIKFEKITMVSPTSNEKKFQIVAYFVDTTYKYFTKRMYSRSWEDKNHYDILDHILHKWCEGSGENEKILLKRYDKTKTKSDFISPYWTPMECISWLNKGTKPLPTSNVGTEMGGYLYYNNTYWDGGSVNKDNNFTAAWKSTNNLFGYPVSNNTDWIDDNQYVFTGGPQEEAKGLNAGDPMYVNKILDWRYGGIDFINIKKIQGAQMLGYNFDGKEFVDRTYKYTKENDDEDVDIGMVDNTTGLGTVSLFPDFSEKDAEIILTALETGDKLDNTYSNSWLRNYSKQQALSVIVRGWEGRFAGMMVKDLKWESFDDENPAGNKNMIGPYLVKSVTHNFGTKNGYTQRVVLLKNAYYKSDNDSLINIGYPNISAGESVLRSV